MTPIHFQFIRHVAEHNLSYATTAEFEARMEIFAAKNEIIEAHNSNPDATFSMAHNYMSTWTDAEYKRLLGFRSSGKRSYWLENGTPNADAVDWVTAGCVTGVK